MAKTHVNNTDNIGVIVKTDNNYLKLAKVNYEYICRDLTLKKFKPRLTDSLKLSLKFQIVNNYCMRNKGFLIGQKFTQIISMATIHVAILQDIRKKYSNAKFPIQKPVNP